MQESHGLIEWWYDRCIPPGNDWDHKIRAELDHADIIVLLVSPRFLASDYIRGVEVERAVSRALGVRPNSFRSFWNSARGRRNPSVVSTPCRERARRSAIQNRSVTPGMPLTRKSASWRETCAPPENDDRSTEGSRKRRTFPTHSTPPRKSRRTHIRPSSEFAMRTATRAGNRRLPTPSTQSGWPHRSQSARRRFDSWVAGRHHRRLTPYLRNTGSTETTVSPSSSACATNRRSNGSRWWKTKVATRAT